MAPPLKVPPADVVVVFANTILDGSSQLCPIAAITTDTECTDFSKGGLDTVCRWADGTPGKSAAQKKVQWKSVNVSGPAPPAFSIEFAGGLSPCSPSTASAPVVTCSGKDAAGLGFSPGDPANKEVEFKYNVVAAAADCPKLDPIIIWRR